MLAAVKLQSQRIEILLIDSASAAAQPEAIQPYSYLCEHFARDLRNMSKDTVVIEIGTALLRVGIAGEPVPRAAFPVSRFPGLQKCSNNLSIGSCKATQLYTEFFHQLFIENLQIKSRDYRVLIIEKFFCPRLVRDCILTSLLRDLQVTNCQICGVC